MVPVQRSMLFKSFVIATGLTFSICARAQLATNHWTVAATNLTWLSTNVVGLRSPAGSSLFLVPPTRFQPEARPAVNQSPTAALPAPGVYRTAPFACIVVVPGNHLDDPMAVRPGANTPSMPVLKPELHFIPLHPK